MNQQIMYELESGGRRERISSEAKTSVKYVKTTKHNQAPVFQRTDIQRIDSYPADKMYSN